MSIDIIGYTYMAMGFGVIACIVIVTELIRINHPDVFNQLGNPGEHKTFDLKAYYSIPLFILKRKHKNMEDVKLTLLSDLALALFIASTVLSLILVFSSNTVN